MKFLIAFRLVLPWCWCRRDWHPQIMGQSLTCSHASTSLHSGFSHHRNCLCQTARQKACSTFKQTLMV